MHPSSLLDALIALFDLEWERAVSFRAFLLQPYGDGVHDVDQQRPLLALLASGQTDEGIAHPYDLSPGSAAGARR